MSMPTNTLDAFTAKGNREDLEDIIYDISPTETPMVSAIERTKADGTLHEWQSDVLAAASKDNAVIEGDDVTADAATATVRVGNYTQLMDKVVSVTSTQRSVNTAGRKDELGYQLAKRGKELKRDIEAAISQSNHAVAGVSDTTARKLGGAEVWISTAARHGAGGSTTATTSGAPTATKLTDGTQRAFTEDEFLAGWQTAWENGGDPSLVIAGAFNKRRFSTFTGNATKTLDAKGKKLVSSVDIYVGDFGTTNVVASRFNRTRTVLGIDPEFWKIATLQAMKTEPLAKTGHAEKRLLSTELTLVCGNEKANFKVADLTTS
jgi:hypothetical protein